MRLSNAEARSLGLGHLIPKTSRKVPRVMNVTERRYAEILTAEYYAGLHQGWEYEPDTLTLGPRRKYTPDFKVWIDKLKNVYRYHEVKGAHIWPKNLTKLHWAAQKFATIEFRLCQWKNGEWKIRVVPANEPSEEG